ncbi:hypothetical protein A1O3_10006 [Capronia epimyces CBS 606.96]|uniref:Glutamine amidotransferase type-2 domain-containing protein n=1 Tax=Capronia epimyces CBS 606.96 TaxID=1182542 RepID=W9XBB4_9EURO|nr:uncharacterized protein A1O3_10006 [Capronia epimyces CBS 606.96]EXJ77777.1 hypothetical protein A1O3_10006 [Capronia epimyces CBS 606.96]
MHDYKSPPVPYQILLTVLAANPLATGYEASRSVLGLMCGIFFSIARDRPYLPDPETVNALRARGPDSYRVLNASVSHDCPHAACLTFVSSVLALRGNVVQQQPLYDDKTGAILCWNGEAWKTNGVTIKGNDSARVFDLLLNVSQSGEEVSHQRICEVLTLISGPFAFVFYNARTSTVYYGRDRLGRRSLLIDRSDAQSLTLSSTGVSNKTPLVEVSPETIHYVSIKHHTIKFGELPWLSPPPAINKDIPAQFPAAIPSAASVNQFLTELRNALALRVVDIPDHSHSQLRPGSAKVAILFSGGLDCTLLARLVHDILPPDEAIDLLNVAFENPRSIAAQANHIDSPYELCPDRLTGRSSFSELCQVCPGRKWRFVAINIPYTEAIAHRPTIISLMSPHNTEMDLSIAMALYFAARGGGVLTENQQVSNAAAADFLSTARVLLSGLGADELYGGYSRHSAAFARGGYSGLADELEMDFTRIGSRNLGRDDRVMSHWGKEIRYPYLDEDFVSFSLHLPVWEKTGFRPGKHIPKPYEDALPSDIPESLEPAKMLMRLAMWQLDMKRAATERKRAIQFGARTAKMDVGKGRTKGTDILIAAA